MIDPKEIYDTFDYTAEERKAYILIEHPNDGNEYITALIAECFRRIQAAKKSAEFNSEDMQGLGALDQFTRNKQMNSEIGKYYAKLADLINESGVISDGSTGVKRIDWKLSIAELLRFVGFLVTNGSIDGRRKWQTTCEHFTVKGKKLDPEKISTTVVQLKFGAGCAVSIFAYATAQLDIGTRSSGATRTFSAHRSEIHRTSNTALRENWHAGFVRTRCA